MMADRDTIAEHQRIRVVGHVQNAEILDVGPIADTDVMDVPANDRVEPDAGLLADDDISDHQGRFLDEGAFWDGRSDSLKGSDHRPIVGEIHP